MVVVFISAFRRTLINHTIDGVYFSISKILRLIHNSPLKFFGDVYVWTCGSNCLRVCVTIILHDVFQTLPLMPIIYGFVFLTY